MAAMTVQTEGTLTFAAVASSDTIAGLGDGRTALLVKNGAGSSITVTVTSTAAVRAGLVQSNKAVTVAAGATALIAIDPTAYADNSGTATIGYSSTTTITSAAFRI